MLVLPCQHYTAANEVINHDKLVPEPAVVHEPRGQPPYVDLPEEMTDSGFARALSPHHDQPVRRDPAAVIKANNLRNKRRGIQ